MEGTILVKSISVQMQWSEPIYVSQNVERDQVVIQVFNETFVYQPGLQFTSPNLDFTYQGKVS